MTTRNAPRRRASPFECSALAATIITGRVCYSGGGWLRPDKRGGDLMAIFPRISRALALLQWETDCTVSFVEPDLVEKGVVARYGYRLIEPGLTWRGSDVHGDVDLCLCWMDRRMLLNDLAFVMRLEAEVLAEHQKQPGSQVDQSTADTA